MILVDEMLQKAVEMDASDIFIVAGHPCAFKIHGTIVNVEEERLLPSDTKEMIAKLYEYAENKTIDSFLDTGDDDFSFSIPAVGRFRVNVYMQRNSQAAVLRVVKFELPQAEKLGIPQVVTDLYKTKKGMILVTGPAGSGKSTTLACILDKINTYRSTHIITIEDPIEYLHRHKKSIVSQREVLHDTKDYLQALRAALREAPEVILVGEMRDLATINTAITAAETGHLLISSLHTVGAANTIDRMIDVFPAMQQQQIRLQLSLVLNAVISQQLVPGIEQELIPVFEIMIVNPAIRSLIREGKAHQIENAMTSGRAQGMITMDEQLFQLYQQKKITRETAIQYSTNPERMTLKTQ